MNFAIGVSVLRDTTSSNNNLALPISDITIDSSQNNEEEPNRTAKPRRKTRKPKEISDTRQEGGISTEPGIIDGEV